MGPRKYHLDKLEYWTNELRQWRFDRALTPEAHAQLAYEAQSWRKHFEVALSAGWIERGGELSSSSDAD